MYLAELPSKVSEGLVRIRHAVGVLTLGDCGTFFAVRCHQFICQLRCGLGVHVESGAAARLRKVMGMWSGDKGWRM